MAQTTSACRDASQCSFSYSEQLEPVRYASAMQDLNEDSSSLMMIKMKKIIGDLSACIYSLFYSGVRGDSVSASFDECFTVYGSTPLTNSQGTFSHRGYLEYFRFEEKKQNLATRKNVAERSIRNKSILGRK